MIFLLFVTKEYINTLKIYAAEENISQEFRLKNIDERRNDFIVEINQKELMNKKHKKICTALNYIEQLLILASAVTGCVSISDFASLVGISIHITSATVGFKISLINARIND